MFCKHLLLRLMKLVVELVSLGINSSTRNLVWQTFCVSYELNLSLQRLNNGIEAITSLFVHNVCG